MPATISHALSATTPDDPAYEIRPSHWNSSHLMTLALLATEISGLFSNANGISFGLSDTAITASQAGIISASAGTTRATSGELVFSNSNGLAFGINGNTLTGSYTVPTVPSQFSGGNSTGGNTLGDSGVVTGRLVLAGGPNITLSGSTNGGSMTLSISGGAGAAGNTGYLSAGTTNASLGTVSFANSNGLSFGIDGQTFTASHNGLTSQSNQAVSGQNGSFTFQTASFSNANGISFGTSAGPAITASHNALTSQSNQAVSGSNGSFTFQTATFGNLNGFSFYTSNGSMVGSYTVPAAQSNQTLAIYALGNTTGQSSSSTYDARTLSINGAGFISVGWSNGSLYVSATQTNPVVSNAIQSVGSATGSGTNTSRFAADDHVHAGVFSLGVSTGGNTAGNTRVDVGRFVLAGGANITLSQATAANALNTISIVGGAGGGAESNWHHLLGANTAGNTTASGTTIGLSGINMTLSGTNGSVINLSVPATSSLSATGIVSISVNGSTISVGAGLMPVYATSNTTQSSSGSLSAHSLLVHGAGGVSVGVSNGSLVISGGAGGGGFTGGMSNIGNTAGTSGTVQSQMLVVGGPNITVSQSINGNSATLSISANAPGAAAENNWFNFSGDTAGNTTASGSTINLSGVNLTISGTNNSQIAIIGPQPHSFFYPYNEALQYVSGIANATLWLMPVNFPNLVIDRIGCRVRLSKATNSTGSLTVSYNMGLYTKNVSTLSLAHSVTGSYGVTLSGTVNSSNYSGVRDLTVPWTTTIPSGGYWVGYGFRTTTGNNQATVSMINISQIDTGVSGLVGQASNATNQRMLGQGIYSATTSGLPASIAFTQITGASTAHFRPPVFFFLNGTV